MNTTMENQLMSRTQLVGQDTPFKQPGTSILLQLKINSRSEQLFPRSQGGQLVQNCPNSMPSDKRLMRKCMIESKVLQVANLHIINEENSLVPCFSALFTADAHKCEDDVFAKDIVIWLDAWCCDYNQLLLDPTSNVATSLWMISNYWYDKLNIHCVLSLEIPDLYFRPMIIAAQDLQCENWNVFHSVSLWSQINIIDTILEHQLWSHTMSELDGQQRSWKCLYVCRTINRGDTSRSYERDCLFMNSKGTWFFLPDDLLVEDAVLSPFGLCHQRWTTTSLLLIPRFNGGDPLRLSSVMVHQNLQLNLPKPRVHTPDRLLGEPPAGHQLVWSSTIEALEDCRCSNIESVLSTDDRSLFGFICNLWCQLQVFRSSLFVFVHLGTFHPARRFCRRDMLYSKL